MSSLTVAGSTHKEATKATPSPFWNPYVAGFGLGLVLFAAYLIAGRGLGATGAFSSVAAWIANASRPSTRRRPPCTPATSRAARPSPPGSCTC